MTTKGESMEIKTVLSVLGKDRKGVVATVATTLYEAGANIDDIQQTLLGDIFSMTMLVTVDEATCSFNDLQERLSSDSEKLGMQINLQREDVFTFMYKV
jgi:ACT domain-containing protein